MMPDPAALKALIFVLLTWISANTHYPMPDAAPGLIFLPPAALERLAGSASALGVSPGDGDVYLDARLDIFGNVCARSVLLHELVHIDQDAAGMLAGAPPPIREAYKEREAYALEKKWLLENGVEMSVPQEYALGAFTDSGKCGIPAGEAAR